MNYPECKKLVNQIIKEYLVVSRCDTRIRSGMEYILDGGKRLRPVLTLAVLEKLQPDSWTDSKQVCLIAEFIHSSSLIIDDLPAFDNALQRRGKKCVHLVKGEGLAYLLSFNLVTEALLIVHKQLPQLKKVYPAEEAYQQYEEQLENIITNISGTKAISGQLLSTFHTSGNKNLRDMKDHPPPKLSRKEICDILYKKTSSFFEISIAIGWIVGHGDRTKIKDVEHVAKLLGLCYQIYDDFLDYNEDVSDSDHFSHNYVYHRGIDLAYEEYLEYQDEMTKKIIELGLSCPMFDYVKTFMNKKILNAKNTLKEASTFMTRKKMVTQEALKMYDASLQMVIEKCNIATTDVEILRELNEELCTEYEEDKQVTQQKHAQSMDKKEKENDQLRTALNKVNKEKEDHVKEYARASQQVSERTGGLGNLSGDIN